MHHSIDPSPITRARQHAEPFFCTIQFMISPTSAAIVFKTHGKRHNPITRLVSPGDVGQLIKPFVFLDYIEADAGSGPLWLSSALRHRYASRPVHSTQGIAHSWAGEVFAGIHRALTHDLHLGFTNLCTATQTPWCKERRAYKSLVSKCVSTVSANFMAVFHSMTFTPFQKATRPRISSACGLGSA